MPRSSSGDIQVDKIGKLLSSYYHDEGQSELSPMSSMAEVNSHTVNSALFSGGGRASADAGRPEPLGVTLNNWRTASSEEKKLKSEAKALLYENCDKFFACVGLIARLDKDVSKVQSEQMLNISSHTNNLACQVTKISSINEQDPVKYAETQFLNALEASNVLNLPAVLVKAKPYKAIRHYTEFATFFAKFSRFPLIRSVHEAARVSAAAAYTRVVTQHEKFSREGLDDAGIFSWTNFSGRITDLVYGLEVAPEILGKDFQRVSANLARLAFLAEAQVAEGAMREATIPSLFQDNILNDVFERSREMTEKLSFPGTLLDMVIPCIRKSTLRLLETGEYPHTVDAENFARRVSYYFRFAKDVVDVDQFFREVCERWTINCFNSAKRNFIEDFHSDANKDHQVRMLQSRIIAASAESAKIYSRFAMDEEFALSASARIKDLVYACLCGQETAQDQTLDLIKLHRQAEIKNTYLKFLTASLEDYCEPRQLDISAKDTSDHIKNFLYQRYLKQSAALAAAGDARDLLERVTEISAAIDEASSKPAGKVGHWGNKGHITSEIVQAERLLARRMENAGKLGEWRVNFFRNLIKTAVERRRAGLAVAVQAAAISAVVDKTVQSESLITLKAMLDDLKEAEKL